MSALDSIKLVGAIGGIFSSIKLFFIDKRLTRRQRVILVSLNITQDKQISFTDLQNHGLIFEGKWRKHSDLLARFVLDISDYALKGAKDDEVYSHDAEIQLRDLADKKFVIHIADKNTFRLTLKGQKWARLWTKLLPYRISWFLFFPKGLRKVYDSQMKGL
jgi:hypothetical protein